MFEINSKIKVNHNSEHPIEKNDWFKGGRDNNLDVFKSEGVIIIHFYLKIKFLECDYSANEAN